MKPKSFRANALPEKNNKNAVNMLQLLLPGYRFQKKT